MSLMGIRMQRSRADVAERMREGDRATDGLTVAKNRFKITNSAHLGNLGERGGKEGLELDMDVNPFIAVCCVPEIVSVVLEFAQESAGCPHSPTKSRLEPLRLRGTCAMTGTRSGIVGDVARDHGIDQWHFQGVRRGDRHLDLGRVRPMVLAVAELE